MNPRTEEFRAAYPLLSQAIDIMIDDIIPAQIREDTRSLSTTSAIVTLEATDINLSKAEEELQPLSDVDLEVMCTGEPWEREEICEKYVLVASNAALDVIFDAL